MSRKRRLFTQLLTAGLPLSLAALLLVSTASAQPPTGSQQPRQEVPEAEQPGTPDEAQWWQDVRATAAEAVAAHERKDRALAEARRSRSSGEEADLIPPQRLQQFNDEIVNTTEKFLNSLRQGREKSYRVPLASQRPIILHKVRATYTDEARRRKVEGVIAASVRFQADGTLGEVSIIRGLGSGLDENAIRAARQVLFLPAVKDGAFVTVTARLEFTFKE